MPAFGGSLTPHLNQYPLLVRRYGKAKNGAPPREADSNAAAVG
jgi:hypothetical protein